MTQDVEARRGVVTVEDDGRQRLEFSRSWPDPIDDVWAALTEPDRMARWIGTYEGARSVGGTGTFTMTQEDEQIGEPMVIRECDPPRRLVVEWTQQGTEDWSVALDLWAEDGQTRLRFTQVFPAGADVVDLALGWHWYLDKLGAQLGDPAPGDWDTFLSGAGPAYGRG